MKVTITMPLPAKVKQDNIKDSRKENQTNARLIFTVALVVAFMAIVGRFLWAYSPSSNDVVVTVEPAPTARPQNTPIVAKLAVGPTSTPVIIIRELVVTATPEPSPTNSPTPVYVYIASEVTRLSVEYVPVPATPTAVPAGYASVCIFVDGVSAIWYNGVGMVGNTCQLQSVTSLYTDITIRVENGQYKP